jgi:HSP20 family molecular chaperone IbpA
LRGGKFRGCSVSYPDIEKAEQEVKRKYYNGRMTKKYRRVIRMNEKLNYDLVKMVMKLGK